eukprot:9436539-Alexandrium_andersonii.AAC.1
MFGQWLKVPDDAWKRLRATSNCPKLPNTAKHYTTNCLKRCLAIQDSLELTQTAPFGVGQCWGSLG